MENSKMSSLYSYGLAEVKFLQSIDTIKEGKVKKVNGQVQWRQRHQEHFVPFGPKVINASMSAPKFHLQVNLIFIFFGKEIN